MKAFATAVLAVGAALATPPAAAILQAEPAAGQPLVSAHRGGAAYAPENTMAAFRNAVRLGVDQLEADAQLTADGVALDFDPTTILDYQESVTQFVSGESWYNLSEVQEANFPHRTPGQPNYAASQQYFAHYFRDLGYEVEVDPYGTTDLGCVPVVAACPSSVANVVATKLGTEEPGKVIFVAGGHYDMVPGTTHAAFDDTSTVATWLRDSGYRTGHVGKYLNEYGSRPLAPRTSPLNPHYVPPGWDHWQALVDHSTYNVYNYRINDQGTIVPYGDRPDDYQTAVLAERARRFIVESRTFFPNRPIFLSVAPLAPHVELASMWPTMLDGLQYPDLWRWWIRPDPRRPR